MKVLIAGAGNMGKTYARSFLSSRFIQANDLFVLERTEGSASSIKEIPAANIHRQAGKFISGVDIIILSVKPQDFPTLAQAMQPFVQSEQLILSIMAGIRINAITGSPLTGANITLQQSGGAGSGKTRAATTDAQGKFGIYVINPGGYNLSAAAGGFITASQTATIAGGRTSTTNFALTAQGDFSRA